MSDSAKSRWLVEALTSLDEIDAILAIEEASFTNPWTREMYVTEFENSTIAHVYFARSAEHNIVGFCSCWLVLDELHINNLGVLPAYRRAGVGSALLTHVLSEGARLGARRATLEVRRSNGPARVLYERFGFSVAGVRRGYYSKPVEDAIVLWREGLGSTNQRS